MALIKFDDVLLQYPIYGHHVSSLRSNILHLATAGKVGMDMGQTVVTALKNASFTIRDGDAVGLIGHNGAGKSSLLRAMAGIFPPTDGKVTREGRTVTVFDVGAGLQPELTGYENIIALGIMMGLSYQEAKGLRSDVEDFTEMGDFLNLPVRTYSTGMTMRLMFAVATAITPEILLLDEMFSTGDVAFKVKSEKRIESLIRKANIFVFASHDQSLISKYCNRVFRLHNGIINEEDISLLDGGVNPEK